MCPKPDIIGVMDRHSLDLETALRVLCAVTERREPDPTDVRTLRLFAGLERHLPPDELACEVIQKSVCLAIRATPTLSS
jgi:hypothetical protein